MKRPAKPLYIRFGAVPRGQHSTNWYLTEADPYYGFKSKPKRPVKEIGVSCYYAHRQDGGFIPYAVWAFGEPNTSVGMDWYCYGQASEHENALLLEGDEVGKGQDGEPLIRNVKVVAKLTWHPKSETYRRVK
jgi:hypothetical protein